MIEASVIIGTLNQKDILKRTLESLFSQTCPADKYELVLVDSRSSDGTEEMVKSLKPPCQMNYFRQENKGKVNARNNALRKALGAIILFTDADIPVEKNWIEEHIKAHQKYKNTAFAGQTIRLRREDLTDTELPTKYKAFQKIPWSYFMTGNLSISRDLILKAGLFDENFKEYGWEDIELGYRLHKMGIPLRFLSSTLNHHIHPVSEKDFLNIMYKMGKSAAIFYKKHPNLQIKLYLGMNPLAMGLHSLIKKNKWLFNYIEKKAQGSKFFRYLLEQYYYLNGLKEVLASA
ncbi:MAG: glycosyltransferase [Candidatus Margulisiibacteriota bacterium]